MYFFFFLCVWFTFFLFVVLIFLFPKQSLKWQLCKMPVTNRFPRLFFFAKCTDRQKGYPHFCKGTCARRFLCCRSFCPLCFSTTEVMYIPHHQQMICFTRSGVGFFLFPLFLSPSYTRCVFCALLCTPTRQPFQPICDERGFFYSWTVFKDAKGVRPIAEAVNFADASVAPLVLERAIC